MSHFWKPWLGVGVNSDFSYTSRNIYSQHVKYGNIYVGPCFAASSRLGKHFRIEGNIGCGFSAFIDEISTEYSFGIRASFSAAYMLSNHIGIGLELCDHTAKYEDRKGLRPICPETTFSINRTSILFGIRIYQPFKNAKKL
jgi:hypothetical protein